VRIFSLQYNELLGGGKVRFEFKESKQLKILCAKSVSMAYGDNLHRGNKYSRLNS
jgi:hypothetical protein